MALLDQFGNPLTQRFAASASRHTGARPDWRLQIGDIDKLIPQRDWQTLLSCSQKIYTNMGIARGAVLQKAAFSVGRGFDPAFNGTDTEWGDQVREVLVNEWFPVCDVRGSVYDWKTNLYLDSVAIDRDGDFFVLLTKSESGYPMTQRIPAHRVGQRDQDKAIVETGTFKGAKISHGVIRNNYGRAIGFRVLGETPEEDTDVSSASMHQVFDPDWYDQSRGIPALSHALNDLRDMLQSQQWEQMAQLMLSSIGLIEYNEHGGPDTNDPYFALGTTTDGTQGLISETMEGGMVRYFRANSGAKLESVTQARPGEMWESFQDRLARSALVGMNWPYSFVWKPTGQGTAERADIQRARRAIEDRQDIIAGSARRQLIYAISVLAKIGRIPQPKSADWWKWSFTMPPDISIDGRDERIDLELWRAGMKNMGDIVGGYGKQTSDHLRERAREVAMRKRIAREVSEETGEEIEEREMAMLTPNDMAEDKTEESKTKEEPDNETD
jgi:hypothetical protein